MWLNVTPIVHGYHLLVMEYCYCYSYSYCCPSCYCYSYSRVLSNSCPCYYDYHYYHNHLQETTKLVMPENCEVLPTAPRSVRGRQTGAICRHELAADSDAEILRNATAFSPAMSPPTCPNNRQRCILQLEPSSFIQLPHPFAVQGLR